MSDFSDNLTAAAGHLLDHAGQTVLWLHPDDPATHGGATVVVEPEARELREDDRGRMARRVRGVLVRTADIGGSGPTLRCNLTINGEAWQVEAIEQMSAVWTRFRCVYLSRAEQVRAGMRKE